MAPGEVGLQVELALETLAPLTLPQLYYTAISGRRDPRRRSSLPPTAAGLPPTRSPNGTASSSWSSPHSPRCSEGPRLRHHGRPLIRRRRTPIWDEGPVPAQVLFSPLLPEATEEDRARARDELLRRLPSREIVDLAAPPAAETAASDRELASAAVSLSRACRGRQPPPSTCATRRTMLLRRGRARALWLWRALLGCFIALGAMALGEVLLLAGGLWQTTRLAQLHAQAPGVEQIITAQEPHPPDQRAVDQTAAAARDADDPRRPAQ